MSDPTLSDIDFKNKMALVWTTLKASFGTGISYRFLEKTPKVQYEKCLFLAYKEIWLLNQHLYFSRLNFEFETSLI